ncbi:hypothetical protein B9Z65_2382 [Elsinoe australis]|uniref:ASST-domain-containing protein n=1 Tax=Elsinoe australis TaxID=40998 RepID=A0A2P7ZAK0_9PEZI|nr:hypothetical protein B9Z65_2382 [Elsinoe australis]
MSPSSSKLWLVLGSLSASLASAQSIAANNSSMPTSFFYTRPQSAAPVLDVTIQGNFSQGYVFVAPYQAYHPGPYIYDKFGNLIWDGYGVVGASNAHNFRPCSYQGSDHLCYSQMNQQLGYGIGQALIVNSDYRTVTAVQTGGNAANADMHEFQLIGDGQTAVVASYQAIPYDLSGFNITSGMGWLSQGVFQEVNVTTGEVLYEWFSSNHVDPSMTMIKPNSTDVSGDGLTPATAFDYFHINSVDKSTASGDYLVSARHTSTIYLVNGTDRNIIWQLSSQSHSDFRPNFNFSSQHDARFISENDTTTVISLFDNASNGYGQTDTQSSGKVVAIDHNAGTATLLSQTYFPREGGILSTSQGNTQVLANGNTFHGWGNWAYVSEHNSSGDAVFFAQFASDKTMNYRAFSMDWTSTPSMTVPEVYSYAQSDNSSNRVYVSWNGATEVAKWRFYASAGMDQDFQVVGEADKSGFETRYVADAFFPWWRAEALDGAGNALRNSSFQPTFVPSEALSAACTEDGCAMSG